MAYHNATCHLIRPKRKVDAADALQRTEEMVTLPDELRCSLRAMSAQASIGALGKISLSGWACRLQTSEAVAVGWRLTAIRDGEADWHEYHVAQVKRSHHYSLVLERVD